MTCDTSRLVITLPPGQQVWKMAPMALSPDGSHLAYVATRGGTQQLYLGALFYEASRKLIKKGADGMVFIADSQEECLDVNLETLENGNKIASHVMRGS